MCEEKKLIPATDEEAKNIIAEAINEAVEEELAKLDDNENIPEVDEILQAKTLEDRVKILKKQGLID